MLKALIKKQFLEIFQNLFRKNLGNKKRGRGKTALISALAVLLIVYVCWMFLKLARSLVPLASVGLGWLYYLIFTGIAVLFGLFGSVFNTFSGLYQAKDNDLLLSMPIPSRVIITARLTAVYVMGFAFSGMVFIPASVVYIVYTKPAFSRALAGVLFVLPVSLFVLTLSCALGWVIAKIYVRIRHKSAVTVIASLIFVGAYYFLFFKGQGLVSNILLNGRAYGSGIKGNAYPIYAIGRAAEGAWLPFICVSGATAVLLFLTCLLISRGFIKTATGGGVQYKKEYKKKDQRAKGAGAALFVKELRRFTSSPTYMLNCGLGSFVMIAFGVFLLIKGTDTVGALTKALGQGSMFVIAGALLCLLVASNSITGPSISLEGKSIWLAQSLPVDAWKILRAKLLLHLALTEIPALICGGCVIIAVRPPAAESALILITPLVFGVFVAAFGLFVNLKRPNLNWTSETAVVKQSLSMFMIMMGDFAISAAYAALWFFFGRGNMSPVVYMVIWLVLIAAVSAALLIFLKKKGPEIFRSL